MEPFPLFLSVVFVVRNQSANLEDLLTEAVSVLTPVVSEYELIVVDNASSDDSLSVFARLTGEEGLPNLQVYALSGEVDADTAFWVGLENALGDYHVVIDPLTDDVAFLPQMLDRAVEGFDIVFANNQQKPMQGLVYQLACRLFYLLYKWLNYIDLPRETSQFRVLSKRVVNFILQHPQPAITYRHIQATGGFSRIHLTYSAVPKASHPKRLGHSIDRAMRLLVSTTRAPMRLVSALSLFGAFANIVYSIYVLAVGFLTNNIQPGWTSLSLQQSGMFFLISLVLLVIGEYILQTASLSNQGPLYFIAREFTSVRLTRCEKLNIEEVRLAPSELSGNHH